MLFERTFCFYASIFSQHISLIPKTIFSANLFRNYSIIAVPDFQILAVQVTSSRSIMIGMGKSPNRDFLVTSRAPCGSLLKGYEFKRSLSSSFQLQPSVSSPFFSLGFLQKKVKSKKNFFCGKDFLRPFPPLYHNFINKVS